MIARNLIKLDLQYSKYILSSPAKINLRLNILKKRHDGYHELKMDLLPIDLSDKIIFYRTTSPKWLEKSFEPYKTIHKFLQAVAKALPNIKLDFDLELIKNIPHQAGLGGSSGNIAGVNFFLAATIKKNDVRLEIEKIAANQGKDVAFFIQAKPSIAKGAGDIIYPFFDPPILPLIIFKPDFNISTAEAYSIVQPNENLEWPELNFKDLSKTLPTINSFWNKNLPFFEHLKNWRNQFLQNKRVQNVFLSGSGSALVLIFKSNIDQQYFFDNHKALQGGRFYKASTLKKFEYTLNTS